MEKFNKIIQYGGQYGAYAVALYLLICLNIGLVYYAKAEIPVVLGLAGMAVAVGYCIRKAGLPSISNYSFAVLLTIIVLSSFGAEVFIVQNCPFEWASDPVICQQQAIYMLQEWHLGPDLAEYFYEYPNNINLLIILGFLYRLLGNYDYVVYIFLILVNLSSIFACLTVRNLTKNNFVSIIILVLLQIFAILTTRTYMPYTSNLTILFPILTLYLYTSGLSTNKKLLLIPLVAAIGYQSKLTCLISFIALVGIEAIKYCINHKAYRKAIVVKGILSTILFFGLFAGLKSYAWRSFDYTQDDTRSRGFSYFLFLGHNPNTGGQWDAEYVKLGDFKGTKAERDAYFYGVTKDNIKKRGLVGNVKFYLSKTVIGWGCAKMDYIRIEKGFDHTIYTIRLYIWYIILTLAMLAIFFVRNRYTYMTLLTLTGVMVYLWLSECSFTYVIMFSPMVFALAGVGVYSILTYKKANK